MQFAKLALVINPETVMGDRQPRHCFGRSRQGDLAQAAADARQLDRAPMERASARVESRVLVA